MSAETWGIVLRDRATDAEQWVACEVTRSDDRVVAASSATCITHDQISVEKAVIAHGRWIARNDSTMELVRVETPAEYAAHMEGVRLTLAVDEVERLRAEVTRLADTLGAIGRSVGAESCDRDVILAAIRERGVDAFRRGAEVMREAAARECDRREKELSDGERRALDRRSRDGWKMLASEQRMTAEAIRALPLSTEAAPPPAQSHEAPATPDVPLSLADAAARARSAAAQRAR